MAVWIGVVYILLLCGTKQVECQNNTSGESPSVGDGSSDTELERAIEKGMAPLYTMTNFFLDLVQPEGRGNLVDTYKLHSGRLWWIIVD